MKSLSLEPESSASANSATSAYIMQPSLAVTYILYHKNAFLSIGFPKIKVLHMKNAVPFHLHMTA